MNLKKAQDDAIKIIDEYSIQGDPVDESQLLDYRARMTAFANPAQEEVASLGKVESSLPYQFTQVKVNEYKMVEGYLPGDFKELKEVLLNDEPFLFYKIRKGATGDVFCYNNYYSGKFKLYYYVKLEPVLEETDEFQVEDEACSLIPYYMAAMVTLTEKPKLSKAIMQEYLRKFGLYNQRVAMRERNNSNSYSTVIDVTGW